MSLPHWHLSFFAPNRMAPTMAYERLSEAEQQPAAPGLIKTRRRRHWFCVAGLICLGVWVAAAQGVRALNRPYLEAQQNLRPAAANGSTSQLPVVLWHGMGDSCCADWSIGAVADHLRSTNPGVFVYSIATGSGMAADTFSGYFGNLNDQVATVCKHLAQTPELAGGFNAVGFSQGGQFIRAVLERCQHTGPRMHTLVTLGGQHQGIMSVPTCWSPGTGYAPSAVCRTMQRLLGFGAYLPWVRYHIVQAQYFKDPFQYDKYVSSNVFLADLNNERAAKIEQYKTNMQSLDKLVLFRFTEDLLVVPRDSAWFGYFNGSTLQPMEDTQLYQEDWIGLKDLQESGRLIRADAPGMHMHFTLDWFDKAVVTPYLRL